MASKAYMCEYADESVLLMHHVFCVCVCVCKLLFTCFPGVQSRGVANSLLLD